MYSTERGFRTFMDRYTSCAVCARYLPREGFVAGCCGTITCVDHSTLELFLQNREQRRGPKAPMPGWRYPRTIAQQNEWYLDAFPPEPCQCCKMESVLVFTDIVIPRDDPHHTSCYYCRRKWHVANAPRWKHKVLRSGRRY